MAQFVDGGETHSVVADVEVPEYVLGNSELPIYLHRAEIEYALKYSSLSIIVSPTGTGKSTQVPQFACEMRDEDGAVFDTIIMTQPRIPAARNVADRIAFEITEAGEDYLVGYYTSKEGSEASQREQDIALLTDGKAFVQLIHGNDRDKQKKKLLIIDEFHEKNINIEALVAIATEKTDPKSKYYDPNLKVVIMSATMDSDQLVRHFSHISPAVINVKMPMYEVVKSETPLDVGYVALVAARRTGGKVLVFLPGKREIKNITEWVEQTEMRAKKPINVIPLHGQQTPEEQQKAFAEYGEGVIILTTNVAETSLTVPEAVVVVDSGQARSDVVRYDLVASGSDGLYLQNVSQSNLQQRAGRVGRVQKGEYFLCASDGNSPVVPAEKRPKYPIPAIQRSRLDGLVLQLAAAGRNIESMRFLNSPPEEAVMAARLRLVRLNAITDKGKVTKRGEFMCKLPLEAEYSCMLAFAFEKGYSDEIKQHLIDIVSIMQSGGILKRSPEEQKWRELLARNSEDKIEEKDSDFFAQLEIYLELMDTDRVKREDWEKYDIIESSAELVQQTRETIAKRLGIDLAPLQPIKKDNRATVLLCLNAGMLNQLWKRDELDGEKWLQVVGRSDWYDLTESSVINRMGKIATGTLFTLGIKDGEIHRVQNLTIVTEEMLETVAEHLIRDVEDLSSSRFDEKRKEMVVRVHRKLGPLVLRSFDRVMEFTNDSPVAEAFRVASIKQMFNDFTSTHTQRPIYDLSNLDLVIDNPEQAVIGQDPMTGEPVVAYLGARGWSQSRDVAVGSLVAMQRRLQNAPNKAVIQEQKLTEREYRALLRAVISKGGSDRAKGLLAVKPKSPEQRGQWIAEARPLIEELTAKPKNL